MSPSDPSEAPPPEVLAIAVAIAAVWPGAELSVDGPAVAAGTAAPSPWRWAGRRWGRQASHKWS